MAAIKVFDSCQENFFECSLPEHSKVYYHPQRVTEGGESI